MATKTRRDGLPEQLEYRDTGCDLAPSCLRCPFRVCRYDRQNGRPLMESRNAEIAAAWERGTSIEQLAERFGLSTRSVHRVLREPRTHS